MWDLDYITSKQHTQLYTQTVQGLADYNLKFTYYASLAAPDPSLTYFIANGWMVPDYYNYARRLISARMPSLFVPQFVSSAVNLIPGIEIQNMNAFVGHK